MYYLFALIFKKLFFGSTFHYHCDSETVAIWFKIAKWFCWNKHLCHFKYVLIKSPTVCSTSSVCVSKSLHSRNECWRNRMLSADMCHSVIGATHPAGCCRHTGAQTNFTLTNTNIEQTHTPKYTHKHSDQQGLLSELFVHHDRAIHGHVPTISFHLGKERGGEVR